MQLVDFISNEIGFLMGPLGMIIAVPSYTVIKVILKQVFSENKIVKSLTKDL